MANVLSSIDYVVIILMLLISMSIGVYYRFTGGRQKTTEEYFSANRTMSILPVSIALMVSFMSAISLLGVSAEMYTYGTMFYLINISYLLGTPIACYCYLPVFYQLQATSVYEYLDKRFGMWTRLAASFLYWIQLLLYSGIVLYAPALALEATTGLNQVYSIVAIGLACAFYSSIGGIKAVLITDVFQGFLMFTAVFLVIFTAARQVGGFGEIFRIAQKGGRVDFSSFSLDPTIRHTWLNLTIGGLCTYLSLYGVHQVQVQRLLTVRNQKSAKLALWINWPILSAFSLVTCFSGLAIYSKYYKCDPLTNSRIETSDMLMPLYVMDTMSGLPGLPGLFISGIFSAGLSTISAALNSLAAVTLEDYIKPVYLKLHGREFPQSKCILTGKILAFTLGLVCILLAYLAKYLGGVLQASLTIFGVVGGPLLGLFTLGMLVKSANQRGAIIGAYSALIFLLWASFGQPRPPVGRKNVSIEGCNDTFLPSLPKNSSIFERPADTYFYLYRISYMWYSPLGCVITLVVGYIVSNLSNFIFRHKVKDPDPNLFFPFIANRLRKKLRKKLRNNAKNRIYAKNDTSL